MYGSQLPEQNVPSLFYTFLQNHLLVIFQLSVYYASKQVAMSKKKCPQVIHFLLHDPFICFRYAWEFVTVMQCFLIFYLTFFYSLLHPCGKIKWTECCRRCRKLFSGRQQQKNRFGCLIIKCIASPKKKANELKKLSFGFPFVGRSIWCCCCCSMKLNQSTSAFLNFPLGDSENLHPFKLKYM